MILRLVEDERPDDDADADFAREVLIRAELIVLHWRVAALRRRIRELKAELPEGNPLRGLRP